MSYKYSILLIYRVISIYEIYRIVMLIRGLVLSDFILFNIFIN